MANENNLNSSVDRVVKEVRDYYFKVVENNEREISQISSSNSNNNAASKQNGAPKSK